MGPGKSLTILLASTALGTLPALPALAQQVGTATAVNPVSERTPPGGTTVTLKVGARIVHKERIHTSPKGTVQLLFLDKTTLSIAPNTTLVIDSYVYNPARRSGHMATRLIKGALRFVGGQLSHNGQASVTTPTSTIGIRGGTGIIKHDGSGTRIINLFGNFTIETKCQPLVIRRPGFASSVANADACPTPPERVTAAEIAHYLALLTSHPGQNGGVPGLTNALLDRFGIGPLSGTIGPETLPVPTDTGESNAFQLLIQAVEHGSAPNPPLLPPPPPPLQSPPPPRPPPQPPPPPPPPIER